MSEVTPEAKVEVCHAFYHHQSVWVGLFWHCHGPVYALSGALENVARVDENGFSRNGGNSWCVLPGICR